MLDAYIKKDDALRLVNDMLTIKGFINRADLQREIIKLQQYKKPQNETRFKVNNAHDILRDIARHPHSNLCKEVCNERRERLGVPNNEYFKFIDVDTGRKIEEWEIVETGKELAVILGITEQTVTKWKNEGMIRRHNKELVYVCGKNRGTYWLRFGYYYDLNEIREVLRCLK